MKRTIFGGVLTIGLLSMVLSAPGIARADYFGRIVNCPTLEGGDIPLSSPDTPIKLDDVILSASGPTFFELFFNIPVTEGNGTVLQAFLRRGGNLVSNFSGDVEGRNLVARCRAEREGNTTRVFVGIVGTAIADLPPAE